MSVIGDFNAWDPRRHSMRKHIPAGVWELFVPGLGEGTIYKYSIRNRDQVLEKSDPYGFAAELPPRTASKVADLDRYHWHDTAWMANRQKNNALDGPAVVLRSPLGQLGRPGDDPDDG